MSKRGALSRGRRIGLRTVSLPADERGAGQVVRTLFQGRYGGARAVQLLAQVFPLLSAQRRIAGGLGQQTTEAGQDDDALLQGRELGGGQRRIRVHVRADECRQVGGRFHGALCCPACDHLVIPWPQAGGDAVGRRRRRLDPPGWGPFESSSERMPIRARVDSDIPRLEASSAKRRFSSAVGRAVIEGGGPALTPSLALCVCAALIGVFDLRGKGVRAG